MLIPSFCINNTKLVYHRKAYLPWAVISSILIVTHEFKLGRDFRFAKTMHRLYNFHRKPIGGMWTDIHPVQKYLTRFLHVAKRSRWSKYPFRRSKLSQFSESAIPYLFGTVQARLLEDTIDEMYRFLAFISQQKSHCVTWYYETNVITQRQWNYTTRTFERPHARNSILLWVKNFNGHGKGEVMWSSGRSSTSVDHKANVSNYFNRYPPRFKRRAKTGLQIPRSAIQRIQRKEIICFRINQILLET